ncbi:MAG: aminodeoxychorismate synthase, component I [Tepidisphaera sp.]|nr:aminodeoxychorismate synthase, component I [Tepidisphaera sp.]
MHVTPLELNATPQAVLAAWPEQWPLASIFFVPPAPHCGITILARPTRRLTDDQARKTLAKPLTARVCDHDLPAFQGGLIGIASYELGLEFEPRGHWAAAPAKACDWPRMIWFDCPDALVFDHATGRWWRVGEIEMPELGERRERWWRAGPLTSATGRAGYEAGAARVLEYIRAGDVYQANLAHCLEGAFEGSTRGLFGRMMRDSGAWYGAYLEWEQGEERRAIASQSPELFLAYDPATRTLETRPMKGTGRAGRAAELEKSPKEQAELAMIVDLMRNDLGRVCELGSVRVETPRTIERHGLGGEALLQATATVRGSLRAGASVWDVLRATFPGGSVTGAPKVRAMQIIDELEPRARGPYCGAIGFVSESGHVALNLAIRTALVEGPPGARRVSYSVGAGIVADSEASSEYAETMAKAAGFLATLGAGAAPEASRVMT